MKTLLKVVVTLGILTILSLIFRIPFVRSLTLSILDIAFILLSAIGTIASFKCGRIILGIILAILTIALFKNIPFMFSVIW